MSDKFENYKAGLDSPIENAQAVTAGPSALSNTTRAIYVGTAGSITVTMVGGQSVTFSNVPAGSTLPFRVTHVTAGSDVVALW